MKKSFIAITGISIVLLSSFGNNASIAAQPSFKITGFVGTSYSLTSSQQSTIAKALATKNVTATTCTGYYPKNASAAIKKVALNRAKSTCSFVSVLLGPLKSKSAAVSTNASSLANTVALSYSTSKKPAPFAKPFPTNFTKDEVIRAALVNLAAYSRATDPQSSVEIIFESSFPESDSIWAKKMVNLANQKLPFPDKYPYLAAFGSTDGFLESAVTKAGGKFSSNGLCNRKTTYESYCASAGWAAYNYMDSIQRGYPIVDSGKRSVVAHELFHVWQKTVDGSPVDNNLQPDSPNGLPLWFAEGNANFFGFAMTHNAKETDYFTGRYGQVDAYMNSNNKSLKEHVNWGNSPYGIGQASAEYLVASVGFEKVLDVYRLVGKGTTFASAFEQSIGISLDAYYAKFDSVRKNFIN